MKRLLSVFALIVMLGCESAPPPKKEAAKAEPAKPKLPPNPKGVPDVYKVRLDTTKGPVVIEVHRDWAPRGADRFWELVNDNYYTDAAFFRMVANYVAQFGIAANPAMTKKWAAYIDDDPVIRTNKVGAVAFANSGPNTRNTQVFINLRSNQNLDNENFAPFGQVIQGMENVEKLYKGYANSPNQERITASGNAYLKAGFPNLDYIRRATIVKE